jgi:uncharacterized phage protein (TIGR02218 family)
MITTTPSGLAAWLASARQALIFDAYTLISVTGTIARWIDADFDYTVPDGRAFVRGPLFERGSISQKVGLSVDSLSLNMIPVYRNVAVTFGAQTLLEAAQRGTLRGATLQLERLVFATDVSDYQGLWIEFAGTLSVRNTSGGKIQAQVLSELNLLDKPMPPDIYQAQCKNTVFDPQCGLRRPEWEVASAVTSVTAGARSQFTSGLGQAAGYFNQGVVQFTSGANAGEKRTVKAFAGGVFSFALPWPQPIAVSDTFIAVPGCPRSLDVCTTRFNNRVRYRGEPFIPQPETVT